MPWRRRVERYQRPCRRREPRLRYPLASLPGSDGTQALTLPRERHRVSSSARAGGFQPPEAAVEVPELEVPANGGAANCGSESCGQGQPGCRQRGWPTAGLWNSGIDTTHRAKVSRLQRSAAEETASLRPEARQLITTSQEPKTKCGAAGTFAPRNAAASG